MKNVKINLRNNFYQVQIGYDLISNSQKLKSNLNILYKKHFEKNAYIAFDSTQFKAAQQLAVNLKKLKWKVDFIKLNAGERLKNIKSIIPIYDSLISKNANRRSVMFALGGGTVGDAMGFVAGTYMRGMGLVFVPTTLLSQVDSSLGGKCGVNLKSGKNLVGMFNQPNLVLCDLNFINSLSKREIISGYGELLKMALLFDKNFYLYLKKNYSQLTNKQVLEKSVARSLELKAKIVEKDEFDLTGVRELLNFGHTIAHAIEKNSNFNTYRHGEAVLLGMRAELRISMLLGVISNAKYTEIESFLKRIQVEKLSEKIKFNDFIKSIQKDKKKIKGKTRFVLLKDIERPVLETNVPVSVIKSSFEWIQK